MPSRLCDDVRRDLAAHFDRQPAGRLLNAWEVSSAVRALATHPAVVDLVAGLLGHPVVAFQTLDFRHGTEQDPHVDSLFFDTLPRGRMCGVWVALEDTPATAGPLRLWPGSHRTVPLWRDDLAGPAGGPPLTVVDAYQARLDAGLPDAVDVTAAKGDVIVWAANLLHGGAPILDPASTRWSQVTHYVATGHVYLSPLTSDVDVGRYMVRDQLVDVASGRRVPHHQDGQRVAFGHGRGGLSRLHAAPGMATRLALAAGELRWGWPTARRTVAARLRRALRRRRNRPVAS